MGIKKILFVLIIFVSLSLSGQSSDHQEEVYLSVNTTNILVGETLHFSAFVYSNKTKKSSLLSSVLYIELVDGNGRSIHQSKVGIKEGRGSGDIYINSQWMSGTYRLVAYTRWMTNYNSYFEQNILVFNPYNGVTQNDSISGNPAQMDPNTWNSVETYGPLEEVSVNLGDIEPSTLSIAINKFTQLYYPNEVSLDNESIDLVSFRTLPEYKYALIQGQVSNSSGNKAQTRVNMSIKGKFMQIATTKTDENGMFWMHYNPDLSPTDSEIQVEIEGDSAFQISMVNEFERRYEALSLGNTLLDSMVANELVNRSVKSQIQMAYKKQSNDQVEIRSVFTRPDAKVYYLDDYERYSSVRDTFIELTKYVGVSKSEDNYKMSVRCEDAPSISTAYQAPLVLLDGIKVTPKDILDQSPNDIEKIEVIPAYYFVNDVVYKGVISVHSFGRKELSVSSNGQKMALTNYQSYSANGFAVTLNNRHPNYDTEIYWEPIREHVNGDLVINFSTSRLEGNYLISVKGITRSGKPVNLTKRFVQTSFDQ